MPIRQPLAQRRRGFTLTEAAIVLGIVGLILGAIWVAAGSVYGNLRMRQASESLLVITQNVRQLMTGSSAFGNGAGTNITVNLINKNVFPANNLVAVGNAFATINPWLQTVNGGAGGVAQNSNIRVTVGPNDSTEFIVSYRFNNTAGNVSGGQRDCAAFLAANLRIGPVQIWDGTAGVAAWVDGAAAVPEAVSCGTATVAAGNIFYGAHFRYALK